MKSTWLSIALAITTISFGCGGNVEAPTGSGGAGGAGGAGGEGGSDGSCSAAQPCAQGTCIYAQGACEPDAQGTCQLGYTCDGPPTGPVCGCDGKVVEGEVAQCTLWSQGKPFDNPEACATGTFACGTLACKRHVEVCVATLPGMPGPTSYECKPLSDFKGSCAHGIADCSCMDLSSLGGATCAADANHQETITVALP